MTATVIISGSKLRKYVACERLPFMDAYADPSRAVEPPRLLLPDLGRDDAESEIGDIEHVQLDVPARTDRALDSSLSDGPDVEPIVSKTTAHAVTRPPRGLRGNELMQWTAQQMRDGAKAVAGGLLRHERWFGSPEWILRRPGVSKLGHYLYEPVGRRWAKKATIRSLVVPLAFYGLLLERAQGARPRSILIRSEATGATEVRKISDHVTDTLKVIERVEGMLEARSDPGPRLKSDCEKCRWQRACRQDAEQGKHVTLLPNIRANVVGKLAAIGVNDLGDFVRAPVARLQRLPGFGDAATVQRLLAQAAAYLSGKPVVVGNPDIPGREEVEAFLDFEADPMTGEAFLTGLMISRGRRSEFIPFLATSHANVAKACREFVTTVSKLPKATRLYHYGSFERSILRKFPAMRGVSAVEDRLFDLLPVVRRHAGIPSRSFALKDVAAVLGIKLPDTGLDGRGAPAWWEAWVCTGDERYRDRLLVYNKADLQAVRAILRWLRIGPRHAIGE